MTVRELFHETFSCLHASDTIYEEVLEMAENQGKRKRRRMSGKAAAACIAAVIVSGITVAAAAQSEFFQSVFGTKGLKNMEAHKLEEGNDWLVPARFWEEVDEETAGRLTGGHVMQIGETVTVYGYTLKVEQCVMDDNGIGAFTYTLSHVGGLEGIDYWEYGGYLLPEDIPGGIIRMESSGGTMFCTREIVNHTQTTAMELHAVEYFAPFEQLEDGEEIQIRHSGYEWDENGELLTNEEQDINFVPDNVIVSDIYTSESGYTAHISPLGIRFDFDVSDQNWFQQKLIITYTDGSVYQVQDTDIENQILSCGDAGVFRTVFNRLVDTEKIASITVNGPDGEELMFMKESAG